MIMSIVDRIIILAHRKHYNDNLYFLIDIFLDMITLCSLFLTINIRLKRLSIKDAMKL